MEELKMDCPCSRPPETVEENQPAPFGKYLAMGLPLLAVWVAAYMALPGFADWFTFSLLGLEPGEHLGEAVRFFVYDGPKVIMLLVLIVFFVGVVRSWFTPETTRKYLAGRREFAGNVMAAGLGVLTPFCTCSAVPLFVGFVTAGVPLGVTFSYLISAPLVNEVALALLIGLFGWKIGLLYAGTGLTIAIGAGWIIGKLKMEGHLQDWVRNQLAMNGMAAPTAKITWGDRMQAGVESVKDIVGKVWPYILLGVAVGAGIHGYVPEDYMANIMGKSQWWAVPAAVVMGVPMYTNAAGVIPVIQALMAKGAALGTVLAFMMSVIALSLPEMLILKKVLKVRLIAVFVAVVATGILMVGYLFNLVM